MSFLGTPWALKNSVSRKNITSERRAKANGPRREGSAEAAAPGLRVFTGSSLHADSKNGAHFSLVKAGQGPDVFSHLPGCSLQRAATLPHTGDMGSRPKPPTLFGVQGFLIPLDFVTPARFMKDPKRRPERNVPQRFASSSRWVGGEQFSLTLCCCEPTCMHQVFGMDWRK